MAAQQPSDWDFLLVEQLAQCEGHRATLNALADDLAAGDHERFAYIYSKFQEVLPRLLVDEWVTQSGPLITLALKGKVAARLPADREATMPEQGR